MEKDLLALLSLAGVCAGSLLGETAVEETFITDPNRYRAQSAADPIAKTTTGRRFDNPDRRLSLGAIDCYADRDESAIGARGKVLIAPWEPAGMPNRGSKTRWFTAPDR